MTAPEKVLIASDVAKAWLTKIVGDRVATTLPRDPAKLDGGFLVIPTTLDGPDALRNEISFVVEVYATRDRGAKTAPQTAERLAQSIKRYVLALRSRADRVTVPGIGDAWISSVQYGGGTSAVLGDLGNAARADINLAFRWRPIPAATISPVPSGQ